MLQRYCAALALNKTTFEKDLTGYIRYYEDICMAIQQSLTVSGIQQYYERIAESQYKMYIRKVIESTRHNEAKLTQHFSTAISANQLRKLLHSSKNSENETFKIGFLICIYLYTGEDRTAHNFATAPGVERIDIAQPVEEIVPTPKELLIDEDGRPITIPFVNVARSLTFTEMINETPGKTLEFDDSPILLNRENLDPGNNTITSKIQAEITFNGSHWVIENKATLKSTALQLNRPVALQDGDILLIGNKKYRVNC
ncbi:MAG: hypothetical protein EBZ77_02845 [Chitinophagia bacterium]|nr:hypothetical protein [Chitinophagia bacterium]